MHPATVLILFTMACQNAQDRSRTLAAIDLGCNAGAEAGYEAGSADQADCTCPIEDYVDDVSAIDPTQLDGFDGVCGVEGEDACATTVREWYGRCWAEDYIKRCTGVMDRCDGICP